MPKTWRRNLPISVPRPQKAPSKSRVSIQELEALGNSLNVQSRAFDTKHFRRVLFFGAAIFFSSPTHKRRGRADSVVTPRAKRRNNTANPGGMGILEKIKDIELEMSRTQKNKATEGEASRITLEADWPEAERPRALVAQARLLLLARGI